MLEDLKFKANLSCTVAPCLRRKPIFHKKENKYEDMGKLDTKYKKMKQSVQKAEEPGNGNPHNLT